MSIKILVVGGAGYIGSHMVKLLGTMGCDVTTLDNLSNGYRDAVVYGKFIYGDIADYQLLEKIFSDNQFDVVMHFASLIQVSESLQSPREYYLNNVVNTLHLLNAMRSFGVDKFIFSSTAAIFGEPQYSPIDESHPQRPINPYGRTKLMVEHILADYEHAYGLRSICLRYFNAAGADPEGHLGERHEPETHLIPLVLQVASARVPYISIFGSDYNTPDGTCIRDYIHVFDLCNAHWLALQSLMHGGQSQSYNLGNGHGFSVQEIIDVAHQVTGRKIMTVMAPRRIGDPEKLVADPASACKNLNWVPKYPDLYTIIEHAWIFECNNRG